MSELDALLVNASNNTAGVYGLSADTLAVLFFALGLAQNRRAWQDYPGEEINDTDWDTITELLDWANDELMREVSALPVGTIVMWLEDTPPTDWFFCDGGGVLKIEYPELFALYGTRYADTPDFFGLPDLRQRSPYGASLSSEIDTYSGELTHVLTTNEMPAHTHAPLSPLTTFLGNRSGGTNVAPAGSGLGTAATTGSTGGGQAHNNLHPVFYCYYIVYAGKQVV